MNDSFGNSNAIISVKGIVIQNVLFSTERKRVEDLAYIFWYTNKYFKFGRI